MEMMQIEARLRHGSISHRGSLNLDALLVYAASDGALTDAEELPPLPEIPIASLTHAGQRVFLSSDAIIAPLSRSSAHAVKRRDQRDIELAGRKFKINAGPDRNRMVRFPVTMTSRIRWAAIADAADLQDALNKITHLGANRAQGYGQVGAWALKPSRGNPLAWQGTSLRALPADWLVDPPSPIPHPVRPPYWHADSVALAVPAGSPAELRPEIEHGMAEITGAASEEIDWMEEMASL